MTGKGDNPRRWVATEDVAALVTAVSVQPDPPPEIDFGGPEALTRNQAIAVAERATDERSRSSACLFLAVKTAARVLPRANDALASVFGTLLDAGPHASDLGRQRAHITRHLPALRHRVDRGPGRSCALT